MRIMSEIMLNTSNKVLHKLNWTIAKFLSEDGKVKTEKEAFSASSNPYGEFC